MAVATRPKPTCCSGMPWNPAGRHLRRPQEVPDPRPRMSKSSFLISRSAHNPYRPKQKIPVRAGQHPLAPTGIRVLRLLQLRIYSEPITTGAGAPFGEDKYPVTVFFALTLFTTISNNMGSLPL